MNNPADHATKITGELSVKINEKNFSNPELASWLGYIKVGDTVKLSDSDPGKKAISTLPHLLLNPRTVEYVVELDGSEPIPDLVDAPVSATVLIQLNQGFGGSILQLMDVNAQKLAIGIPVGGYLNISRGSDTPLLLQVTNRELRVAETSVINVLWFLTV